MERPVENLLRRHRTGDFLQHLHEPTTSPVATPRVAIGDLVEQMLASVGITKSRVLQWTRMKDCGCATRQRWLNQWGYKQQERIERLLNRAAKWYGMT
jgi:hypothetical protein